VANLNDIADRFESAGSRLALRATSNPDPYFRGRFLQLSREFEALSLKLRAIAEATKGDAS
jgi:hypothetical protein